MGKRHYKKRLKVKLKKETVYTILALGLLVTGLLGFLSFTQSGEVLVFTYGEQQKYFGSLSLLFPITLILFGFLFLRFKKFWLSKPHVAIGFVISFLSLLALLKTGAIGQRLFQILSDILGQTGTDLVYIAGLFVGIVVFFNTSLDELMEGAVFVLNNIPRFVPRKFVSLFKKKKFATDKPMAIKQMMIKGGQKETAAIANDGKGPTVIKKEPVLISDKLVSNVMTDGGVWQYPSLSLLSENPGQKAERGDIKKIASTIERT
ncbi:MAG: DNA translocase FtsK 4TM domain-containing protein, partial [Candidatus Levyibacteriota bacterium]